jgi:hypothetical protein
MHRLTRIIVVLALAAATFALVVTSALAKTERFTLTGTAKLENGNHLVNVACSGTFGKCKVAGTVEPPDETIVWTLKGGKLKATSVSTTGAANHSEGTFKIVGGTGKFKHAKGKGTYAGFLSTGTFTYKGKITY